MAFAGGVRPCYEFTFDGTTLQRNDRASAAVDIVEKDPAEAARKAYKAQVGERVYLQRYGNNLLDFYSAYFKLTDAQPQHR